MIFIRTVITYAHIKFIMFKYNILKEILISLLLNHAEKIYNI